MKKLLISLAFLAPTAGVAHAHTWYFVNTDDSFDKRSCIPSDKDPEIETAFRFGQKNVDGRYIAIADGSRVYAAFWHAPNGRRVHLAFASTRKTCLAILESTSRIQAALDAGQN